MKKGIERERGGVLAAARTESKVWKIINRRRKGRKKVNESIEKEE